MAPNNELETCLINICKDYRNQEKNQAFYDALIKSDIYLLSAEPPEPKFTQDIQSLAEKGYQVEIGVDSSSHETLQLALTESQGKKYVPFFSSLERVNAFTSSNVRYFKFSSVDFFKMQIHNSSTLPLVLNPRSYYFKTFTLHEVKNLANGINPAAHEVSFRSSDTFTISELSVYPTEFIDRLIKEFKKNKHVKKAFLVSIFNPSTDVEPVLLLVIDVKQDIESVVRNLRPIIKNDENIGIVDICQFKDPQNSFEKACLKTQPFYKKKILGIF